MTFPQPLAIKVQAFIFGEWVDFGPIPETVDDFFTDVFTDVFLGRIVRNDKRLPAQELQITAGRADEGRQVDPSNVSILLWNPDGWLTPDDPRSPWWSENPGGWGLNTPIRILVDDDEVFNGEVSSITPLWRDGDLSRVEETDLFNLSQVAPELLGYAHVQITCSGILRRLAQRTKPLRSPLTRLAQYNASFAGRVYGYWPFEDGSDATSIASGLDSVTDSGRISGFSLASDSTLPGSDPLPKLSKGSAGSWSVPIRNASALDGGWAIDHWGSVSEPPVDPGSVTRIFETSCTGDVARWQVDVMFDGEKDVIWLRGFDAAGAFVTDGFEPNVPDDFYGHPMQYTLAVAPDLVTFSWRKVGDTAITGLGTPLDIGEVGYPTRDGGTFIAACGDVTVGHVTVRSQSLVAAWATPADEGWPDDTAVQRIRRLCDERGVTLVIDGEGTVGSTKLGIQKSGSFLDLLHDPADADLGLLQEARVGGMALRYRPRRSRYNLAPVWTINAKTDGFQNPFEPVRDDQQILNDITVNRIDGSSFHRVDEASVDKNGTYDGSVSLSLDTDRLGRLKNQAGERIHFGTWAGTRYPQVTVQIETAQDPDAVKAKWKALRVGDVIRLTVLPPQHPQWPDHVDLVVEGWSETLSPFGWTVTMNCSPADPWQRAIYGTFRCFPRNGRVASAVAVDADEIPYTDGGSGWTTDPDAYPMQLILGGSELVEVSGVSGSDPQILAVSERNLNGLGRAHPAGASVVPDTVSVIGL